ncbi:MAG: hypothetical protein ACTHMM_06300 [Agriterribacter sp.]
MAKKAYIFSFLQFAIFFLSFVTDWYRPLVICLFLTAVITMLDKLGKGIVLRETIALHSTLVCLVMPVIGYAFFDKNNALARLWVKSMPVPESVYFAFTLPAVAGFVLTLCWPLKSKNAATDEGHFLFQILERAKLQLKSRPLTGLYIMMIGTLVFRINDLLPTALQFAALLLFFAGFAGLLYVYYTPLLRFKIPILLLFLFFILFNALSSGMFTVVAYMGLTMFSFFFLGRRTSLAKKLLWFFSGIFFMLVLQLVKPAYRDATWKKNYDGNKIVLFSELFLDKVSTIGLSSTNAFFPVYVRTNQGFNVALVMSRMPKVKSFDYGERLAVSFASAWVPRLFWPDKPEAGGKFNMEYYTGFIIRGWSTNVGPLGEAYGSFGATGGVFFMLFLGVLVRGAYKCVFIIAKRIPLIVMWIPVLFYQITYSAETDTLQIMNSLIKSAFFIWLLYNFLPAWFGVIANIKRKISTPIYRGMVGRSNMQQSEH